MAEKSTSGTPTVELSPTAPATEVRICVESDAQHIASCVGLARTGCTDDSHNSPLAVVFAATGSTRPSLQELGRGINKYLTKLARLEQKAADVKADVKVLADTFNAVVTAAYSTEAA